MTNRHGAVILAGGKGTRLLPLTAKTPKPLLPIGRTTPLEMGIIALENAGIKNIAITSGHMADKIENYKRIGTDITYYREKSPMGTSGMVFKILPFMKDDFFVLSGDCVFDFSLSEMMEFHKSQNAAVTIASVKAYDPTAYGTIVCENGRITAFREKPSWKQVVSTKINAGIYILNRKILEEISENTAEEFSDFASELFPFLMRADKKIACFETEGYWCDMGTPESFRECNMHFSEGNTQMGDFVSISKAAKIEGSVIMNGVKVGSGTIIRDSVVGEGVSIGKNCIIDNAIIGPDALICDNVYMEAGSVLESDKIAGKGIRIQKEEKRASLFNDSGTLKFEISDEKTPIFLGKALGHISSEREIRIYYGAAEEEKKVCEKISSAAISVGGKVAEPQRAYTALAAFVSGKLGCLSISVNYDGNEIKAIVFDEYGLPLSREEQIAVEKYIPTQQTLSGKVTKKTDPHEDYKETISPYLPDLSGIRISFAEKNNPSMLCENIIISKGGKIIQNSEDKTDKFFIKDDGTDVYCLSKDEKTINKSRLFAIAVTYFPIQNLPLPEYVPEAVKNLLSISGGSYNIYGDSVSQRTKNEYFYSFNDGVSVALAVLGACKISGMQISELDEKLPPFAFAEKTIEFSGNKGKIYEKLLESTPKASEIGASFNTEKGKTVIIPQYRNAFKIFAESVSSESAEELIAEAEMNLRDISQREKADIESI